MKIHFIKRDGSKEAYDEEKITRVLIAAGLDKEDSKNLASGITNWIEQAQTLKISSQEVRDKIIEELQKINSRVADLFSWYEKTKK